MTRTYTPEAIAALVKAAQGIVPKADTSIWFPEIEALRDALRPFTTEPQPFPAFSRQELGDDMMVGDKIKPTITQVRMRKLMEDYRARYGVEP